MTRPLDDHELLPLLDVLADGAWHSGEALAADAGVTRAALAKRIDRLADWGLEIEARTGLGYRLDAPLERLDETQIQALLSPGTRARLRTFGVALRTDSTNQRLVEADPDQDPQALFAEAQSAGRGRRGRVWRSPFGVNLYLSLAWSFPQWPMQIGTLPLAVGVAAARALRQLGVRNVGLKWPNDLRVGNAKLGGILLEQRGEFGGACRVIAGIGVNVAMQPAQAGAIDQIWTTVAAAAGVNAPTRNGVAGTVLDALVDAFTRFESSGFSTFAADWAAFDLTAGRIVRIEQGAASFSGRAAGIDTDGALLVDVDGQLRPVHAGEVSLRLAAS